MSEFHVGTSGWSYKHWRGVFYPEDVKSQKFLEYYTEHFGCVELNASFYRLPTPKTVENWAKRTPQDFVFCLKLSRLITHQKRLEGVEELLATFFERFRPLTGRLGPTLVQLPPSLRFDRGVVEGFCQLLEERHPAQRFALEARHDSWFAEEALELLREHGVAFVVAHSGGRFPEEEAVTADFVYMRFHGPGKLYASNYPEEMLVEFAGRIRGWLERGLDVWTFFNNDVGGHAVNNARRLRELVERKGS